MQAKSCKVSYGLGSGQKHSFCLILLFKASHMAKLKVRDEEIYSSHGKLI